MRAAERTYALTFTMADDVCGFERGQVLELTDADGNPILARIIGVSRGRRSAELRLANLTPFECRVFKVRRWVKAKLRRAWRWILRTIRA